MRCVLCGTPNPRFVVKGRGKVFDGPHKGKEVRKGDLVCWLCFSTNMAADAGGDFVIVEEKFFIGERAADG